MMPYPGGGGTPTEAGREAGDVGGGVGGVGGAGGAGAAGAAGEAAGSYLAVDARAHIFVHVRLCIVCACIYVCVHVCAREG